MISPEQRETALINFYGAERRAGATPIEANERMHFYAKRLDGINSEYERDLAIIRQVMERTS